MMNYNDYISSIKEGLIKTHNITKHWSTLLINLTGIGINCNIDVIDKFRYRIVINNPNILRNSDVFDLFFSYNNNMGYFPCYMFFEKNGLQNHFTFNKKLFTKNINCDIIKIEFESKYEDGLYKNDLNIPDKCYHLSPTKNRDNILLNGLCPKSRHRKTFHPDRIYMFYDLDHTKEILKSLKVNDTYNGIIHNYDLWEVFLEKQMIIHTDPYYPKGFFTYDNIRPDIIKIIMKNI